MRKPEGHTHTIVMDNTKVNRILIHWLTDTCVKNDIPFEVELDISHNGFQQRRQIVFSYQYEKIFPISKNVNKIRKRLAEKECE